MKRIYKVAVLAYSLVLAVCGFAHKVYAEDVALDIENTLDISECRQGDIVTMSVYLKGNNESSQQDISSMSGILEYDSSLFTVGTADILPAENGKVQSCSFDQSSGVFDIKYSSDISIEDGGRLLQIRLHTAADASTGKKILCVTQMKWNDSASKKTVDIEHRVPARITIAEAEILSVAGDVNRDGKVNLTDAKIVMQHYNGLKTLNEQQKTIADVNSDGKVNLTDAKLIMKYYNREITEF